MRRHNNDGLRKLCECPRRKWAKCPHAWHFSFTWNGEDFRFSLERSVKRIIRGADGRWHRDRATLGDRIDSKTAAETERDRVRAAIRDGSLLDGDALKPQRDTLTLSQLLDTYRKDYIAVQRPGTHDTDGEPKTNIKSQIALIKRTELGRLDGTRLAFGQWLVTDIGSGTIDAFQRARLTRGTTAANRDLALLRAMFRWAIGKDHVDRTPFKKSGETVIQLSREHKRRRRLQPGEGERLLAACGSHLRALVEAAIETGCRRGELLSLQWHQIRLTPKAEIFLPAQKTKTQTARTVPISMRLRAILEMRRNGPDGEALPPEAHVFGNACGEPIQGFKQAWGRAVLRAHGHTPRTGDAPKVRATTPVQSTTTALTAESSAVLRSIDLHFHESAARSGVTLAGCRRAAPSDSKVAGPREHLPDEHLLVGGVSRR